MNMRDDGGFIRQKYFRRRFINGMQSDERFLPIYPMCVRVCMRACVCVFVYK